MDKKAYKEKSLFPLGRVKYRGENEPKPIKSGEDVVLEKSKLKVEKV